jgi:hypothetical protein
MIMIDARREGRDISLWAVIAAPTIWAVHFLLCYVTAAVYCAKLPAAGLEEPRFWITIYTVVSLVGIAGCGFFSVHRSGLHVVTGPPHEADTVHDRRHFMDFATLLLSALSFVSVLFVAFPAYVFEGCG